MARAWKAALLLAPVYVFVSSWFGLTRDTILGDTWKAWHFFTHVWTASIVADLAFVLLTGAIGFAVLWVAVSSLSWHPAPRGVLLTATASLSVFFNWFVYAVSFALLPGSFYGNDITASQARPFRFVWDWGGPGLGMAFAFPLVVHLVLWVMQPMPQPNPKPNPRAAPMPVGATVTPRFQAILQAPATPNLKPRPKRPNHARLLSVRPRRLTAMERRHPAEHPVSVTVRRRTTAPLPMPPKPQPRPPIAPIGKR